MSVSVGFKPVSARDARVLVLGTLPGAESLKQQKYYALRHNSFWKIMGRLVGAVPDMAYEDRLQRLCDSGIALWDVCAAAKRKGSLDANIQSPVANDFARFFKTHKKVELICFNGKHAEMLFLRHVLPMMPKKIMAIPRLALPSTSPAHASMNFEQKFGRWRKALKGTVTPRP